MSQGQPEYPTDQIVCPNCAGSNPAGASFCAHCGQPIQPPRQFCVNCGRSLRPESSFCPECGTVVPPVQQPQQPVGAPGSQVWQPSLASTPAAPFAGAEQVSLWFTGTWLQALGWGLLYYVLAIFIIPAGWGVAALAGWFVRSLQFSDGTQAQFEGRGGQIWGYFPLMLILSIVLSFIPVIGFIITLFIDARIYLAITRWFFSNIRVGPAWRLEFTGSYWPYVGWNFLLWISIFTIIGWAWVMSGMARWYCRNIHLQGVQMTFVGTGWGFLWRGVVAVLVSMLIITIPWMAVWYTRWVVRNVVLQRVAA